MNKSIKLISQNFFKELSTASVDWLLGNVGDKIRIETTFSVQIYAVCKIASPFVVNATDGLVGDGWFKDPLKGFADFNIGDTVLYYNRDDNAYASFTIIDKKDNGTIQFDRKFSTTPDNYPIPNAVLSVTTPITSTKYRYNFIQNKGANSFISPVDGVSEQLFICKNKAANDTSPVAMEPWNALTWQDGLAGSLTKKFDGTSTPVATIQGVSIDPGTTSTVYSSTFKIIHYTKISPYLLYLMTIPPFKDDNCLKFISQIDAAYEYTDPNFLRSQIFGGLLGNVGWYNENFATGKTNYSISNLVYKKGVNAISSILLSSDETIITFDVLNATDTPFSDTNTKFVLQIFKVPADITEYQDNATLLDINFLFDRVKQTVGIAAVNGDNFGGAYQILKSVSAAFVTSGKITVTAKIDMSAAVLASFGASNVPQYFIDFQVQNHTLATDVSDLVTLKVAQDTFTVDTSDPLMIIPTNTFIRHPEFDPATEGITPGYPNSEYDYSAWTGGTPTFNLTLNLNFTIGGLSSFAATAQSTVNGAMQAIVDKINIAAGKIVSNVNTTTKKISIYPDGVYAGHAYTWSALGTGGLAPTIVGPGPALFTDGITLDVFPEDEIVACTNFYIESNTRSTDEIKLTNVNAKIIAFDGTKEFELDQFNMNLSGIPLTGYTQIFDAQVARNFRIPAGTIRKYIEVQRRIDLDIGTRKYFSSNYPLLWRWEDWTAALGVDASFLDTSLPNNGFNEWWYHYKTGSWGLYYKIIINATKNGSLQQYSLRQPIVPHDYASNSAFTIKSVLFFQPEDLALLQSGTGGATQLVSGGGSPTTINGQVYKKTGTQFVNGAKKTLVAAIFTKSSLPANVTVVIDVEVYKEGGIAGRRRYSSKWVADSDTWFSSIDGSGKIVLAAYGNNIVALCYFDPSSLNFPSSVKSFAFTGRIYEIGGVLETDDSVPITTDDGVQIEVD